MRGSTVLPCRQPRRAAPGHTGEWHRLRWQPVSQPSHEPTAPGTAAPFHSHPPAQGSVPPGTQLSVLQGLQPGQGHLDEHRAPLGRAQPTGQRGCRPRAAGFQQPCPGAHRDAGQEQPRGRVDLQQRAGAGGFLLPAVVLQQSCGWDGAAPEPAAAPRPSLGTPPRPAPRGAGPTYGPAVRGSRHQAVPQLLLQAPLHGVQLELAAGR